MTLSVLSCLMLLCSRQEAAEGAKLLKDAKLTPSQAIAQALKEIPGGTAIDVSIEAGATGKPRFYVTLARRRETIELGLDVVTGECVEKHVTDTDNSEFIIDATITLSKAIELALKNTPGKVLSAAFEYDGEDLEAHVGIVGSDGKVKTVSIDAENGDLADRNGLDTVPEAPAKEKDAKLTPAQAVALAVKEVPGGVAVDFSVELDEAGRTRQYVSVARGKETFEIAVDPKKGQVTDKSPTDADNSKACKEVRITLDKAIETALKNAPAGAVVVSAEFSNDEPHGWEAEVDLSCDGKKMTVYLDAKSGQVTEIQR